MNTVRPDARPLVVLDRDGVINFESADFICTPDAWIPIPGSIEAIAALCKAGFSVVVATNQSGIGRGLISARMLEAIHGRMIRELATAGGSLAGIFVCPHLPDAGCDCRKPKPGLLRQIERAFDVGLTGVPMIGDSLRDVEAARAVGGKSILVRTGNGRKAEEFLSTDHETVIFDDLRSVADLLLQRLEAR